MVRACARLAVWVIAGFMLAPQLGHAARRGLEFPLGDVETVMAKRGMATEGFLLTAWVPKRVVAPGEQIRLWLTLRNVSYKVLSFQRTVPEADFALVVQDASGHMLLPKKEPFVVSRLFLDVQPGESLVRDYRLLRMYDLSAPGAYSITATAKVKRLDGEGWTDVVADTVTLTVTSEVAPPLPPEQVTGALLFKYGPLNLAQVRSLLSMSSLPSGGFRLNSVLPKSGVVSREPVALTVTLENLSSEIRSFWETSPEFDIGLIVEGPQGPLLPDLRQRLTKTPGHVRKVVPGERITHTFAIDSLYNLRKAGVYRITPVQKVFAPGGQVYVVSNTVVLTVTPKS